ncbi:LIM domain-containing protein A [Corythoichthys intestinalis]|uniref:LIM domain-containing protein A n=1 Tax=Corythoichthys intestinalis TaxID=161448 RepID=UPI0025A5246F|nr:LIM domain-containing protein A [Corythoichthys intestinalis]XP_057676145.1 LIM domain-containing protein A [Corythoichthys intestinalis]
MCDQREKVKNKKTDGKSQQIKHHHIKQNHRQQQHHHQQHRIHQSENDYKDMHSTEEESLLSDCLPHQHHSHRYYNKQNHGQLSLSETSFTSSYDSSSTSSSSTTTSSCSSSSSSSCSSASSSSLSSESSTDGSDTFLLRRPQHSQSCNNISEKQKCIEEDTTPLTGNRRHVGKQKQTKDDSSNNGFKQGTQKKTHDSFRKSKSMEALSHPSEKEGYATQEEQERRKIEVKKNLMKEKMKFSAFLNEITRQVLSPMRLTTLGVTDARKASDTEATSVRSRKSESSLDRSRRQRSRPVSADSVNSNQNSRTHLSKSTSPRNHRSHGSPDSSIHMQSRPRSCTDINCLERHPSWSQTSQRCSHSPYYKQRRGRNQGERTHQCHHHSDRYSPSYHKYPHNKGHHHHRRCHSPVFYPDCGDRDISSHHNKHSPFNHYDDNSDGDHYGVSTPQNRANYRDLAIHQQDDHHFHYQGYYSHGHVPRHRDRDFATHHCEQRRNQAPAQRQIHDSSSSHHKDHQNKGHHHSNHFKTKRPTTPRHGSQAQISDHSKSNSKHHHADHHDLAQHHNLKDHQQHYRRHVDHHSGGGLHRDHQQAQPSDFDLHCHGEQHRSSHQRQHGNHHSPNPRDNQGDEQNESRQLDKKENKRSYPEQRHGVHHSPNRPHYHEDKHSRNLEDHQSKGHQHQQRDKHNNSDNDHRQHHHGEHKSPNSHLQHETHHSRAHQTHHGDMNHSEPHQTCFKNAPEHQDKRMNRESDGSLPPHQKKEVLNCKLDSSKKMSGPCGRAEEQTDFTGPSIPHESTHEMDKIMVLEKENEGLQQNLLKQTVKMECFGDFLNSHKLLEEELQRTRAELSDLTESFKILHENCSSTQQTNSLLEQKLNSVTKSMEGERERLSRRISALTEQLASAKFANNVDTLNVNSVLNKSNDHFLPDDAINQLMLPLAPPPVQFMDIQNYEKIKVAGQEQSLGSVPEEEESDWSEMGDEIPRFILTGSNRSQTWMPRDGDMDKDSESGGEDIVRLQSPRPLQIPHLQFTIHNEMFPAPPAIACPSSLPGESAFRITTSQNLGSTILIRSASLEEIPLACRQMSKELRGTEAMMDLHHPEDDTNSDLDNEIIHHWRTNNNRDGKLSEPESAPCSLQSVEQMLHQFMYEPQPSEGISQSRSELHGWTEGMAEEVLGGEQTQL